MSTMTQWDEHPGLAPGLRDALRSLLVGAAGREGVWRLGDEEVTDTLAVVGQIRQLVEVAEVALVREGLERGLPSESSWSAHDWVARAEGERAPDPSTRHVSSVVRVAKAVTGMAGPGTAKAGETVERVHEAFEEGDVPLAKADQLVRFHAQVAPVADEEMLAEDMSTLLAGARDDVIENGPEGRRRQRRRGLSERELAVAITRTGRLLRPEKDQDREDRRSKAARSLTKSPGPAGMSSYKVILDAEGAAVLDSAIAALAEPVKDPETGRRDERPPGQRRADALVEIVRRGVSSPGEAPKTEKAQVVVTIGLQTLLAGIEDAGDHGSGSGGGAGGAGVTSTGQVLPPGVVRRMACDGAIIPAVLGSKSEVLDLGRAVRWFTPGQKRAIWLRDQGCTYPGCTMPPQWCDAHHVDWWSRGGTSDVSNGALLCQRHHTRVHDRDLTATITSTQVTWHV